MDHLTQDRLGSTEIPEDVFQGFLEEVGAGYTMATYDIFDHNCNHFSNEASLFLTGQPIPSCESDLIVLGHPG